MQRCVKEPVLCIEGLQCYPLMQDASPDCCSLCLGRRCRSSCSGSADRPTG